MMSASSLVARSTFAGFAPCTESSIRGTTARAPAPVPTPTCAEVTFPRSCPGRIPAARAACLIADSERMISPTARGFVAKLWIGPPPGENGCPSEISALAV